jgi:hypothetical protein
MAGLVFVLCGATSLACALMLFKGFAKQRVRLLLWSGLCFVGLTIENVILYIDVFVVPDVDLSLWRKLPSFFALAILLFGLIWDTK